MSVSFTSKHNRKQEVFKVTLDDAKRVIVAAEKKAAEIGQPMNIAVADADGDLLAHARMDGAWAGCIDISIMKALTSRALEYSTRDLAPLFPSAFNAELSGLCMHVFNHGRNVILCGGVPIKCGGKVVGAIGVSGGSGAQDDAVAEAGAAAFASCSVVKPVNAAAHAGRHDASRGSAYRGQKR